jgi:hypothetical protein
MDFLKHREGEIVFYQVFLLSPLQHKVTLLVKYVRGYVQWWAAILKNVSLKAIQIHNF